MESWPRQWHLVHLKVLLMAFLIATFARVLFLKHVLLLLNVYSCYIFCFQRTDWIKKKLSLSIWLLVINKQPLLMCPIACFCLCSECATVYGRELKNACDLPSL